MQQTFTTSYQNTHTQHVSTHLSPSGVILINVILLKVYIITRLNIMKEYFWLIVVIPHTFYIQHLSILHPWSCGTSRSPFFCNIQNYSCFLIALQRYSDYSWLRPINVIYAYLNSAQVATLFDLTDGVSRFLSAHLSYKLSMCTEQCLCYVWCVFASRCKPYQCFL
jgi:hypothetical protein